MRDPFATEETGPEDWVTDLGPHLMMVVPNREVLKAISTDHLNGGPWVMWPDTPYVPGHRRLLPRWKKLARLARTRSGAQRVLNGVSTRSLTEDDSSFTEPPPYDGGNRNARSSPG